MNLSENTKKELREIIIAEFGDRGFEFSDEEIEKLGVLFLELTAVSLKRKFLNDS